MPKAKHPFSFATKGIQPGLDYERPAPSLRPANPSPMVSSEHEREHAAKKTFPKSLWMGEGTGGRRRMWRGGERENYGDRSNIVSFHTDRGMSVIFFLFIAEGFCC